MKKISVGTLFLMLIICAAFAPVKTFEGTITYSIEYLEVPEEVEGMESMLPQELKLITNGSKSRIEQSVMGGTQVVIVDNDAETSEILMDMMGQKIHVHLSKEEIQQAEAEEGSNEITYMSGKKKILGYACKEAKLTNISTGMDMKIYYTEKLDLKHHDFEDLKGFPLEYESSGNGMKMRISATDVDKSKVDPSVFEVPDGFESMSMDELQQLGQ